MDIWSKKKRSAVMAKIRSKDTKPEWIVRRYLFSRGYRYLKNVKGLPGTPDIVLRKYGIVIFIHGCFWHGHKVDGHIPHSNSDYWRNKIKRNQQRDEKHKEVLKKMGWKVMTIWECQLKPAVREQTLHEMEYWINHSFLEHYRQKLPKTYEITENSPCIAADNITEYEKREIRMLFLQEFQ
ncbi:very short patch repair endonuclease [Bacteroides ovatus]|nr:very short patch repair endonuclease [Bacteroides ovatus]MCS2761246.1 very short patch repair endonuclease [Bacteroides ovatus]